MIDFIDELSIPRIIRFGLRNEGGVIHRQAGVLGWHLAGVGRQRVGWDRSAWYDARLGSRRSGGDTLKSRPAGEGGGMGGFV